MNNLSYKLLVVCQMGQEIPLNLILSLQQVNKVEQVIYRARGSASLYWSGSKALRYFIHNESPTIAVCDQ